MQTSGVSVVKATLIVFVLLAAGILFIGNTVLFFAIIFATAFFSKDYRQQRQILVNEIQGTYFDGVRAYKNDPSKYEPNPFRRIFTDWTTSEDASETMPLRVIMRLFIVGAVLHIVYALTMPQIFDWSASIHYWVSATIGFIPVLARGILFMREPSWDSPEFKGMIQTLKVFQKQAESEYLNRQIVRR